MKFDRAGVKREGQLQFDEMTIQSGVQLEGHEEGIKMHGFINFGPANTGIDQASSEAWNQSFAVCI